ncbi:50S ribosomal protein L10 [Thermodesulfobacteriota bacterium]
MNLDDKKKIVADLHEKFLRSKIVIITDYKGLQVAPLNDLRRKLREAGVEYQVVKNTLLVRASQETDAALIQESFKGPSAIALSYDDPVAPAKVLTQFANEHKTLELKVGVLNGKVLDLNAIKALSTLPSREVLIGHFLSVMNAVPASFVRVLGGIPASLLNVLLAIKSQKEAAMEL